MAHELYINANGTVSMAYIDGLRIDYDHLNRMQRRVMARDSWITEADFRAESPEEQSRYYQWMRAQCGELADLI